MLCTWELRYAYRDHTICSVDAQGIQSPGLDGKGEAAGGASGVSIASSTRDPPIHAISHTVFIIRCLPGIQDDEILSEDCDWLQRLVTVFERFPQVYTGK